MSRIEISKKLVLINSASSLATRMLSLSVLVWLQQYLLKRISAEEYSLLPLLYSIMAFAPLITTVLTGGLGRFITVAYARDDDEEVTRIVSTMFPILCVAGLLFLVGGWTFAWYVDSVLTIAPERLWDARIMMAILMFSAAVRLPLAPFGVGFFVRQKFVLENLIQVGTELFRLTLLFSLLFGVSTRVLWVITASSIAELVNLTVTRAISMRLVPALRFRVKAIHWPIAKEITSFGGWNFVGQLADTVRTSADAIILNKLATPFDMSCYHLGSLPLKHVQGSAVVLRAPLLPSLTALHATGDRERLGRVYVRGSRYGLWGSLLFVAPLTIFSHDIIDLYVGSEFSQAAVVMAMLLPTLSIAYAHMLRPQLAMATGRVRENAVRTMTTHTVNLGLTLYFVGVAGMGAVGSALATLLSMSVCHVCMMWPFGLELSGVSWRAWTSDALLPGVLPSLAASAVWILSRWVMSPASWGGLALVCLPGMVVNVVALLLCFRSDDKAYARAALLRLQSLRGGVKHGAAI